VGALGLIGGCLAKIANEIFNLAHTEIAELGEPFSDGKVGSSTMPHKRNPTAVENVVTVGRALKFTVAFMQEALVQEHERDGANWKIEWKALPEACLMTTAMLAQMKTVLAGLEVNAERMRDNLDALGGFIMSERVMFALSDRFGKQTAHELVYEAAMKGLSQGMSFSNALGSMEKIGTSIDPEELERHLDPTTYLGFAPEIVDRVIAGVLASAWLDETP
jgi:adenylosuccinate lyase